MQSIKQTSATITAIRDLSPTSREYTIIPTESFPFTAGAFVNTFFEHQGTTFRRAFSISSSDSENTSFTLTIRLNPKGALTSLLWAEDFLNKNIRIMGPLGLNTADKMLAKKVYLFGFGVGAGVVKSLADHLIKRPDLEQLTVVTGNRSIEEILHKDYFDAIAKEYPKVTLTYVVSDKEQTNYPVGYIQDHVTSYNFENADVYMCGQTIACTTLLDTIKNTQPKNCNFLIEDFH